MIHHFFNTAIITIFSSIFYAFWASHDMDCYSLTQRKSEMQDFLLISSYNKSAPLNAKINRFFILIVLLSLFLRISKDLQD